MKSYDFLKFLLFNIARQINPGEDSFAKRITARKQQIRKRLGYARVNHFAAIVFVPELDATPSPLDHREGKDYRTKGNAGPLKNWYCCNFCLRRFCSVRDPGGLVPPSEQGSYARERDRPF